MSAYPSAPMPEPDLLDLIADDHVHATDRERVEAAIRACAAADPRGVIDPNALRRRLDGSVYPAVVGATVSALARTEVIRPAGWTISDDLKSRNRGRPQRTWKLADPSIPRRTE